MSFANDRPERKLGHNRVKPKRTKETVAASSEEERTSRNSDRFRRLTKNNPVVTVL